MVLLYDFKFALRNMLQKPGFAAMTIAIMTIGLGLCVFNYSFIYGLMFKPMPFNDGERMYVVNLVANGVEYNGGSVLPADYLVMKQELDNVEGMGSYYFSTADVNISDRTIREMATFGEPQMFEFTQVQPIMGRVFNQQDNEPGAPGVAVIGHSLWQNHLGGNPDVLGRMIEVDGRQTEIIGVMPEGYLFPNSINIWLPMQIDLANRERKDYLGLEVFFKLKEGASLSQLNAQLKTIMARLEQEYPDTNVGNSAMAKNYRMSQVGMGGMTITYAMMSAVVFIMMLACTNVANLLLARASERAKETAIRVALGAPRARLILQMMWESLIICTVSGVIALLLSGYGLQVTKEIMRGVFNGPLPFFWQFEMDSHIVVVTIVISLVTAIITGLLPALKVTGGDFNKVLRDGTRGAQSRSAGKLSKALVILEITLSCALLTTAGAIAIGINVTDNSDYGANTHNKLIARIELPERKYPEADLRVPFYQELIRELEAQPDIAKASLAGAVPGINTWYTRIAIEGRDNTDITTLPQSHVTNMYPGMYEILGVQALAGRLYDEDDTPDKPNTVVVTDSFAKANFGSNEAAVGQRFTLAQTEEESALFTIVGVVPHMIFGQPFADFKNRPAIITNSIQDSLRFMRIVVQPDGHIPAENLESTVSRVLFELDKDVAPYFFRTYEAVLKRNTAGMNFLSDVFNLFAIAAILLAASGIYGVMANTIERRTQELGIRRALGAPDELILKSLMKQGLWQLLIGSAIGAPLAYLMGNQIVGMLGASSPWLDAVYIVMPLLIGAVVLISTFVPALKAIRLEPSVALRYE